MGYDTRYSLRILDPVTATELQAPFRETVIAHLRQESEGAPHAIYDDGRTREASTWYDHELHLRLFSKVHCSLLFVLSGEGEETGDVWKKYFLNGKCQVAKASFQIAPFDPAQLK